MKYPVSVAEQECGECGELKEAVHFYRANQNLTGLSKLCKDCSLKQRNIPEEKMCPQCSEVKLAEEFYMDGKYKDGLSSWCKDCHRNKRYEQKYGITRAEFEVMREWQDGDCLICGLHESDTPEGLLVVDHCHKTGAVRGLLCRLCNVMLGSAVDNPEILNKGAEYLKEFKEVTDEK